MSEIHATTVDTFNSGKWRIMRVTRPGSMPVSTKTGVFDMPFNPGDVLLADVDDRIICGPVSLDGAVDLAGRILDNDARAKTDPLAILILSTALAGFTAAAAAPAIEHVTDAPSLPAGARDTGATL